MAKCDCIEACPFFNGKMSIESGLGKIYTDRYCLDQFESCARHRVRGALGKDKVPQNLYPNMFERADKLIATGGVE